MDKWKAPRIMSADVSESGLIVYFSDGRQALLLSETIYSMIPYGEALPEPQPEPGPGEDLE